MKSLIVALAIAIMGLNSVLADSGQKVTKAHEDYSFVINSVTDFGNEVLYSCDFVESTVTDFLTKLGASNISVSCFGGAPDRPVFSPSVQVSFDSLHLASGTNAGSDLGIFKDVELSGSDNCYLAGEILRGLQGHIEMQNFTGPRMCMMPDDSYSYEISTLFPAK